MFSIMLLVFVNMCNDFCINHCSTLNGNYTNECNNCSVIYLCNPKAIDYYDIWFPKNLDIDKYEEYLESNNEEYLDSTNDTLL